ncbi:MAG TPA: peptidyl-prolyl cis-trans isomerase [candidate division Zixibacteria bacterium]|nr:peptidylprolyl isomerase [candidate division Zixibacteria bacterium]MDD4917099.1 peptidyl-prolyl cis-trans isomerase [candidate division Zixibacteria bacterium]HOD65325.1 peptidyl-prolyl cis-trans isomerase [candidate division Zixibacteria bacterium]HPM36194.1 peptidyl-prolyl cis-trans isomerase [candidate division Zixibacteria bacterium]
MALRTYARLTGVLALVIAACGEPPTLTHESVDRFDRVVARVDTVYTLTFPEFYRKLEESILLPDGGRLSQREVADELDRVVMDTLAGLVADTVNLGANYELNRIYRQRYYEYLLRRFGQVAFFEKTSVDSAAVRQYYEQNLAQFTTPEEVDVSHILIAAGNLPHDRDSLKYRGLTQPELAAAAEKHAWYVKSLLDQGHPFDSIAREYSHDNLIASYGPRIGWVRRGVYEHPFDSVAFGLAPGRYSDPYFASNSWHLIYVAAYHSDTTAPLEGTIADQVTVHLRTAAADSLARPFLDSLDAAMQLEINEAILDSNVFLLPKPLWAAVVNGRDTVDMADLQSLEEGFRKRHRVDNTTPDMKREMIQIAARRYALVQAARAAGIEELPDVREQEFKLRRQYQKTIVLRQGLDDGWTPSDAEIEAYYRRNYRETPIDKPLVVQHIIAPDSASAAFLRDQALAGHDFLALAEQYYPGDSSLRRDLADLGPIGPQDVSPEFYEAARVTPDGNVSFPVQTQYGWHVIKVLEHRTPITLDKVRTQIRQTLRDQHLREITTTFRDRLYRRFAVSFPNRLPAVDLRPIRDRQEGQDGQ